jgi:hypothetical protein
MDLAVLFSANSAQWRECHNSKFQTKSTHFWTALVFWSAVLATRLGNRRPYTQRPQTAQKRLWYPLGVKSILIRLLAMTLT